MSDGLIDHFFASRLMLVRCADWFAEERYTPDGAATYRWYVATVEADGSATVFRRIDPAKIDAERTMIRLHNERVGAMGDAPAVRKPSAVSIDAGRKAAAAQRAGPSPLFNSST